MVKKIQTTTMNVTGSKALLSMLTAIACCLSSVIYAQIDVTVSTASPTMNEPFEIIFSTDQTGNYSPDLSPLNEHFRIMNQQFSQASKYINGVSSNEIQWIISVMAKKTGVLQIPSLSFGQESSAALSLEVKEGVPGTGSSANSSKQRLGVASPQSKKAIHDGGSSDPSEDGMFIRTESLPSNTIKGGQSILTVRLYSAYPLQNANMSQLESHYKDDLVVIPLGGVTQSTVVENHRSYEVFEQNYAVFASKVGTLKIPPVEVKAEIIDTRRTSFFGFMGTQTLHVSSAPITMNVLAPKESHYDLVAHDLKMSTNLSAAPYEANSPMTLSVTLKGYGVTSQQLKAALAPLETQLRDRGLQYYMDSPVLSQELSKDGVRSKLIQKIAIIPNVEGALEIPSFTLTWLNALSLSTQMVQMKAYTIDILPAKVTQATDTPIAPKTFSPDTSMLSSPWVLVSIGLALGWALTLTAFLKKRRKLVSRNYHSTSGESSKDIKGFKPRNAAQTIKALKQASDKQSLSTIEMLIVDWARDQGMVVQSLLELVHYFPKEEAAIKDLHAARYDSSQDPEYTASDLVERFVDIIKGYAPSRTTKQSKNRTNLPPLYPRL